MLSSLRFVENGLRGISIYGLFFSPILLVVGSFVGPHLVIAAVVHLLIGAGAFYAMKGIRKQSYFAIYVTALVLAILGVICIGASWFSIAEQTSAALPAILFFVPLSILLFALCYCLITSVSQK